MYPRDLLRPGSGRILEDCSLPPRPQGDQRPHAGLQWRPADGNRFALSSLLNGSSMVAVVTFHTLHPSNSKCLNNGSLFKAAHFYSATLGICSVVSLVILTAPSQGFRLTRVLGTSLCRVPSGSHYIYGLHVLKFIRRLSCSLADLLFQPTLTCQRHIPMRYRQQGLSLL